MSESDLEYFNFCIIALSKGKQTKSKGRTYITYEGRSVAMARALWNLWHKNDPVKHNEIIYHKDGNKLNDTYENLAKTDTASYMCDQRTRKPLKKKTGYQLKKEITNKG